MGSTGEKEFQVHARKFIRCGQMGFFAAVIIVRALPVRLLRLFKELH